MLHILWNAQCNAILNASVQTEFTIYMSLSDIQKGK